jgi:multisubunit Na+/H+ antiporter MnhG subunit
MPILSHLDLAERERRSRLFYEYIFMRIWDRTLGGQKVLLHALYICASHPCTGPLCRESPTILQDLEGIWGLIGTILCASVYAQLCTSRPKETSLYVLEILCALHILIPFLQNIGYISLVIYLVFVFLYSTISAILPELIKAW